MRRHLFLTVVAAVVLGWMPQELTADEQKLKFGGDLRGRWEGFWFDEDATGVETADRRRIRYRLRLDAKATINDYATAALRFGTGAKDNRSGNVTLGSPIDFGPNAFMIRRAYLALTPFKNGGLPIRDGHWVFEFGRVGVPFIWKNGKDIMLLDNDLNPAGVCTKFDMAASEAISIFANLGVFVIEEKKAEKDPHYAGAQGGIIGKLSDKARAGVRGSWYYFGELDSLFIERGASGEGSVTGSGGNIPDGLTGDPTGGSLNVVETQVFVKFTANESWPLAAFGGYSDNLDAAPSDTFNVGKESKAFNVGVEGGDKKKIVKLGATYYRIEANAFPSQFIDSDLLDGHTNRKGTLLWIERQLLKSTDFKTQLFISDAIEKGSAGLEDSVKDSNRTRIQVDLVYKF